MAVLIRGTVCTIVASFCNSSGGLVDEQLRKSDDVHEQDMADLELSFTFELSAHFCVVD
jgi:hypothetical protein